MFKTRGGGAPPTHREWTPRNPGFGEFAYTTGFTAKGQDLGQITVEYGIDALNVAPREQLNAVDQNAEHGTSLPLGRLDGSMTSPAAGPSRLRSRPAVDVDEQ